MKTDPTSIDADTAGKMNPNIHHVQMIRVTCRQCTYMLVFKLLVLYIIIIITIIITIIIIIIIIPRL